MKKIKLCVWRVIVLACLANVFGIVGGLEKGSIEMGIGILWLIISLTVLIIAGRKGVIFYG